MTLLFWQIWILLEKFKKKTIELESEADSSCNWSARYSHQRLGRATGGLGNKRTSRDHPNKRFVKFGQNSQKSRRDLRWLAVSKTPVRNHQQMIVWKTLKRVNNDFNNNEKNCGNLRRLLLLGLKWMLCEKITKSEIIITIIICRLISEGRKQNKFGVKCGKRKNISERKNW